MEDQKYMALALELAKKGAGWCAPNPKVGAVIVKENRIIGRGWHEKYGSLHAERNALQNCTEDPAGSTIYVTLEPCCHHGHQPPCVEAIIEAGISRVVIGSSDPNPLVAGKGVEILRNHGISVTEGVLKEECDRLNDVFFHYITTNRPFVALKWAMTLDGKIAASTGDSKWVTGEAARNHVHTLRNRYRAILVGVNTVLADDPLLTCRMEGGRNPLRIVCDSHLRTPLDCQLVRTAREVPTLIATCQEKGWEPYLAAGCHLLACPGEDGRVNPDALLTALGAQGIDSVLVEGGGQIHWAFLKAGLVNKTYTYIAPKLLGGTKTPIGGVGFPKVSQALSLGKPRVTALGDDILLESEEIPDVHGNY